MTHVLRLTCVLALTLTACIADSTSDRQSPIGGGDDVVCPAIAVECPDGQYPVDADKDGCALECSGDVACPAVWVECPDGEVPVDIDRDGCALECSGDAVCPEIAVVCPEGEVPMDLDADGCALECGEFCGNNP